MTRSLMIRALILVAALGGLAWGAWSQETPDDESERIDALKAEIERLKGIVPSQAVAMTQVAYNFGNLWAPPMPRIGRSRSSTSMKPAAACAGP